MYSEDKHIRNVNETIDDDCFAEKTKNWIWLLGAVVAGTMIFGVARFISAPIPHPAPRANTSPTQGMILQKSVPIQQLAMDVNTLPNPRRVIVHSVYGWGPARGAGLQVGDRIYRFNGRRVRTFDQFKDLVAKTKLQTSVNIQVIRKGKRIKTVMQSEPERRI